MSASYETIIVLTTKLDEEATKAMIEKFTGLIKSNDGIVESVDEWGKRRLAYEIQKEADGYYVLINFSCPPDFITELNRVYNITDGVLRTIVTRKDA